MRMIAYLKRTGQSLFVLPTQISVKLADRHTVQQSCYKLVCLHIRGPLALVCVCINGLVALETL